MKMKHAFKQIVWTSFLFLLLGAGVITTPAQQPIPQTATVLLTDISGSMDEQDIHGISKLQGAENAILTYINIVEVEALNYSTTDFVSLVTFCATASQQTEFSTDYNTVRNVTQSLSTCGSTDMLSGISLSDNLVREIKNQQNSIQTNIILLTDGLPTASPLGTTNADTIQQEVLDAAASLNLTETCLYIVPLGNPNAPGQESFVDLAFLQRLDSVVNCGGLFDLVSSAELRQLYLDIRLQIVNLTTQYNQTLIVTNNQTLALPEFTIQANTGQLRVDTVVLDNGAVSVNLFDPNGQMISQNYPGASLSTIGNVIQWVIENPIIGQWRAEVLGTGTNPNGTQFTTSISTGGAPSIPIGSTPVTAGSGMDTTLFGIILILMLIAGGVVASILYNMNNRSLASADMQDIPTGQQAYLVFLSGPRIGQQLPITSAAYSIGRRGGNHLQLQDNNASREHARILLRNGQYYLQDLNSQSGTFVNGMQIQAAHPLMDGEQIRIGRINIQFRS